MEEIPFTKFELENVLYDWTNSIFPDCEYDFVQQAQFIPDFVQGYFEGYFEDEKAQKNDEYSSDIEKGLSQVAHHRLGSFSEFMEESQ